MNSKHPHFYAVDSFEIRLSWQMGQYNQFASGIKITKKKHILYVNIFILNCICTFLIFTSCISVFFFLFLIKFEYRYHHIKINNWFNTIWKITCWLDENWMNKSHRNYFKYLNSWFIHFFQPFLSFFYFFVHNRKPSQ